MRKMGVLVAFALVAGLFGAAYAEDDYNADLVPNRLSFAKVGEWASYSLPSGYTQKLTVTKRSGEGADAEVSIRVDNIWEGEVVDSREISEPAGDAFTAPRVPYEQGVTVALRQEVDTLKDNRVAVSVVEINTYSDDPDEAGSVEYWITSDIPVFGILKKVEDGEVEWELADYGDK